MLIIYKSHQTGRLILSSLIEGGKQIFEMIKNH